jgi:ribosome-binding factor A
MTRSERVGHAIKKEVSNIIHDEMKDPRMGFVTITNVELTNDLRFAKIFFSVLGNDEEKKKTSEALDSAVGFIRKLVSERIKLRYSPDMVFKEDRSIECSMHIEEIINELKGKKEDEKSG